MKDSRHILWIAIAIFAAGIGVGLVAPSMKGCAVLPVVPTVQDGPRDVFLIHETADDMPELAAVILDLRTGEAQKYLAEHGHNLQILDDDSEDENKQPAPSVRGVKAFIAAGNVEMPAVVILESKSKKILHGEGIKGKSAADVLAILKAHGG